MIDFEPFPKIARHKRELVVTEKLDGSNAQIAFIELDTPDLLHHVESDPFCLTVIDGEANGDSALALYVGSRKRWIAPEGTPGLPKGCDNFAFARWVVDNLDDLRTLGPGRHFGEWYGKGIQSGYGLDEKRFALFNTARWGTHNPSTPACCEVVTVLDSDPEQAMEDLATTGSKHVPGFMQPEGIVVYHSASRQLYKQTFANDDGKWRQS